MLPQLFYRMVMEVSPRCLAKATHLWVWKGVRAVRAYQNRQSRGELFPPFLFLALTDACNLRCNGCWIHSRGTPRNLPLGDVHRMIEEGKRQKAYFYTLLGGEPMIYPQLWEIIEAHPDCYFQIITNGMFLDEANVERIRRFGNVTPLVSIDGFTAENDARRGEGTFEAAVGGIDRLHKAKVLFGVATTVTGRNLDEVTADDYVRYFVDRGAMYLWYYAFRPMGPNPSLEFCMDRDKMLRLRRRLLELRRKHPIILIDTYWNAAGEAVCPASLGLGFHIGPGGSIEPCPPLSFACENIRDNEGDLFHAIDQSRFLRDFQKFVSDRTCGCVILEYPQELAQFIRESGAEDHSGRDALGEIAASEARTSHHLPGEEIPEDYWVYRFLKRQLFFGMSGYG